MCLPHCSTRRSGVLSFVITVQTAPKAEEQSLKLLCFIPHSEKYRETGVPAALLDAMGQFEQETIGGWAILQAPSRADAVRIATQFMELHRTHWPAFVRKSEVRPMFEPGQGPWLGAQQVRCCRSNS
jgi:hypothetical protein